MESADWRPALYIRAFLNTGFMQWHEDMGCKGMDGDQYLTLGAVLSAGLMQRHEEIQQQRVVDGVLIGAGSCAINTDGSVISPSKMTVDQIRAELIARSLPTDGKRKEIYKRLQVDSAAC